MPEEHTKKREMDMQNTPKTVLCIHSLPCFGRGGLAVIVPVLAALGAQPVPLPAAVLSTHTGGLGQPARMSDARYGPAALEQYAGLGVRFDAVYTGYLADAAQARLAARAMELWPAALKIVDPVLGDHGRLYRGLLPDLVPAMYDLCTRADLILPNLTEAALLLNFPLPAADPQPAGTAARIAERLCRICPQALVTGVTEADGRSISCVGAVRGGAGYTVRTPLQPRMFHGTGDIFGAVLVGRLLQGNVPEAAAQAASAFVGECIRLTPAGSDERLGVWLENALPSLLLRG